jgi:hypothetical protein
LNLPYKYSKRLADFINNLIFNSDINLISKYISNLILTIVTKYLSLNNEGQEATAELCLLRNGKVVVVLNMLESLENISSNESFSYFIGIGKTDSNLTFYSDRLYFYSHTSEKRQEQIYHRYEGSIIESVHIFQDNLLHNCNSVIGFFKNMEVSQQIEATFLNIPITINDHINSTTNVDLINSGLLNYGILSFVEFDSKHFKNNLEVDDFFEKLSFALSIPFCNTTNLSYCQYLRENEEIGISIYNTISEKYRNTQIINDDRIPIYLKCFESSSNFYNFEKFKQLSHLLIGSFHQKYLEIKFANLLMAFEFSMNFILEEKYKISISEIKKKENLQQKLNFLNSYLRSIPKKLLNNNLRENIRNPLFHTGSIPNMDFKILMNCYYEYTNLLLNILLQSFNYSGKYKCPFTNKEHIVRESTPYNCG